jgi:hypothetical protein
MPAPAVFGRPLGPDAPYGAQSRVEHRMQKIMNEINTLGIAFLLPFSSPVHRIEIIAEIGIS